MVRAGSKRHVTDRSGISHLIHKEDPRIDGDRLVELLVGLGEDKARKRLRGVLGQIGTATGELFRELQAGRFDHVRELTREISRLSRDAGLGGCVKVARDLEQCALNGDFVAASAVLHRLARLGAASARGCAELQESAI